MLVAQGIVLLQTVGAVIGFAAACAEVETILASGPILGFVGAALAFWAYRARRAATFYFSLVEPTIYVVCAGFIGLLRWGPHESMPTVAILLAFGVVFNLVFVRTALRELKQPRTAEKTPMQFSLRGWLILPALLALPLATVRWADSQVSVGVMALEYAACLTFAIRAFRAGGQPSHR